jgi:hypothetical protein
MKVEELEVDRLYQSGRSGITNLYVYHGGMAENHVKLSKNLELQLNMAYDKCHRL